MNSRTLTIILIVLATLFSVHLIYQNTEGARADLTENGLYTLTEGTHEILEKMQTEGVQPISVKLYFSETNGKTLPAFIKQFIVYEDYVRNLLKEYRRYSDGKIQLSFIDPKTDSDAALDATDYGLDGKTLNEQGDQFFFGLVFETQTGSKDVIEFLWPNKQETIEYEISKRIYNLLWPTKKRIGIMSSLDVMADDNPYYARLMQAQGKAAPETWTTIKLMQETYDVSKIPLDSDQISHDDYDLVVVVHPRSFGDKTLWALNEWVVTGGNTVVLVDPYSIKDSPPQNPQNPMAQYQYEPSSNLSKLMQAWGIRRVEGKVAADLNLGVKRQTSRGGPAENLIIHLRIDDTTKQQSLDQDLPIFKGMSDIQFFVAGVLETLDDKDTGLEYTPLITTTDQGDQLAMKAGFPSGEELTFLDMNSPGKLIDHYAPQGKQVLAYMINGQFPSAFPQGAEFPESTPEPPPGLPPGMQMPPSEDAEMISKEPIPSDSYQDASVMVFADSDFIANELCFQNSIFGQSAVNDNYKVILNVLDYMLGSKELLNVRSKSDIERPFEVFDRIEAQADADSIDEERKYRGEMERFQKELSEKQSQLGSENAPLLNKKFQDELAELQEKKAEAERQLREIRKQKHEALQGVETVVRIATMWFTPSLVLILGIAIYVTRRLKAKQAKRGTT